MTSHIVLVKNMVCHRCVLAVEEILNKEKLPFQKVLFGEIHLMDELNEKQKNILSTKLNDIGFELIDSHMSGLIEKIKQLVIKKARFEVDTKEKKLTFQTTFLKNCIMSTRILAVYSPLSKEELLKIFILNKELKKQKSYSFIEKRHFLKLLLNLIIAAQPIFPVNSRKSPDLHPLTLKKLVR